MLPQWLVNEIMGCRAAKPMDGEDKIVWGGSPSGEFSVKSAYQLVAGMDLGASSQWSKVWKWEGPHRIKCFMWLVLNGGLKTNTLRARCAMNNDDRCPLCKSMSESTLHILRDCPRTQEVWQLVLGRAMPRDFYERGLQNWIFKFLSVHSRRSCASLSLIFGITLSCIWYARNRVVFSGTNFSPQSVSHHVAALCLEVQSALASSPHLTRRYGQQSVAWSCPQPSWWKVNVDGAVRSRDSLAACGGVFRDENGAWRGGFVHYIGTCSILLAELWGIHSGLNLAKEMGCTKIWVECDSAVAVEAVSKGVSVSHQCYSLVKAIRDVLAGLEETQVTRVQGGQLPCRLDGTTCFFLLPSRLCGEPVLVVTPRNS